MFFSNIFTPHLKFRLHPNQHIFILNQLVSRLVTTKEYEGETSRAGISFRGGTVTGGKCSQCFSFVFGSRVVTKENQPGRERVQTADDEPKRIPGDFWH